MFYYLGLDHMEEIAPIRREVFGAEQGWLDNILFDKSSDIRDLVLLSLLDYDPFI